MELKFRSARTLKVTQVKIPPAELGQLAELAMDPRYESLLNVMERACIELDTAHLNTSTGDPEAVLGGHCVAKAGWLFFAYVQKQVLNAYNSRTQQEEPEDAPDLNDVLQGVG